MSFKKQFITGLTKLVKPSGLLFISSIAQTPEAYFLNIVLAEHVLRIMPRGTHEWDQLINCEDIESVLNA